MEKMSLKEFEEWSANGVKQYLPAKFKNCRPVFDVITKHSGCYNGMYMRVKGENASSVVNMDQFYSMYLGGRDEEEILKDMARVITVTRPVGVRDSREMILDYKQVKKNLFIRIINKEVASESLKSFPRYETNEFILTYNVKIRFAGDSYGSLIIDNSMLKHYGITEERLHKDTMANCSKMFPACYDSCNEIMDRVINEDLKAEKDRMPDCIKEMIIISDKYGKVGSAVLFYPDTLEKISRKTGGDFFVLPYSELSSIAFPAKYEKDLDEYIRFICNTYNPSNDGIILSHNLYKYDSSKKSLDVALQVV